MSSSVHIFGIRHHGPGSARSLQAALTDFQPDCVLVEGPPDADSLITLAGDPAMRPPVALLVFAPDDPQNSVFYPFAQFSPEWQAMRYAVGAGITVRFMDLPQAFQLGQKDQSEQAVAVERQTEAQNETRHEDLAQAGLRTAGDPIGFLAEAAGYTDSERWWEHLVEHRRDPTGVFDAILEAMSAVREAGISFVETEAGLIREQRREAWMRNTIRQAENEGFARIAVVCGAWHAPALTNRPKASADNALLKGLCKIKVQATWIPWTYSRLAYQSGYGAGIESPGWYDHLWTSEMSVSEGWMTKAARLLRSEGLDASPASIIEAVRLADALAALRSRTIPGLAEMNEAAQAVLCFGNDISLRLIERRLIVGEFLGETPESVPMPPLARDLASQQRRLRFPAEAEQKVVDLDQRKPTDLERSRLLHRLTILRIPWGRRERTGGGKGTFHEVWRLQWNPEFAVALIEAGAWGNTVVTAASAFACHIADNADSLPQLTTLMDVTLLADLPDSSTHVMQRIQQVAAVASDIAHLMGALPPLAKILRYGNVRNTDAAAVAHVVSGLVSRICIGIVPGCASLDDDAAAAMLNHVIETNSALSLLENEAYIRAWRSSLAILSDRRDLHGLIAGHATRLLLDAGEIDGGEAGRRMGLAFSTASEPAQAAAWIEGFLRGSGLLLLHDDGLWTVIDRWLTGMPVDTFENLLPLLRRTFAAFAGPERRQMGERVRGGGSLASLPTIDENFDEETALQALDLAYLILGGSRSCPR